MSNPFCTYNEKWVDNHKLLWSHFVTYCSTMLWELGQMLVGTFLTPRVIIIDLNIKSNMWWVVFNYLYPCVYLVEWERKYTWNTNERYGRYSHTCNDNRFSNQTRTLVAAIMNTLMILWINVYERSTNVWFIGNITWNHYVEVVTRIMQVVG